MFETSITESVAAFRKRVIQEAEFQTIASETMHGLTGKADNQQPAESLPRNRNQRTFVGESKNDRSTEKMPCLVCEGQHAIWRCRKFAQKSPTERWIIAKRSQLFCRCLGDGHYGKLCPNVEHVEKNGCQEIHHRLLHQCDSRVETASCSTKDQTEPKRVDAGQRELLRNGLNRAYCRVSAHLKCQFYCSLVYLGRASDSMMAPT